MLRRFFSGGSPWGPPWRFTYNLLRVLSKIRLFLLTFSHNDTFRNVTIRVSIRPLVEIRGLKLLTTVMWPLLFLINFNNNFSVRLRINFLHHLILELFLAHFCDIFPAVFIFDALDYHFHLPLADALGWAAPVE